MINTISPVSSNSMSKISFKGDYSYNNDQEVRDYIRKGIESKFDASYQYSNQMGRMTADEALARLSVTRGSKYSKSSHVKNDAKDVSKKKAYNVNFNQLKNIANNSSFVVLRKENELYSGPRLNKYSGGIKSAADAGIKTIVSLEPLAYGYRQEGIEEAEKAGVKLIGLENIGNKNLNTFSVIPNYTSKAPLLTRLIDNPKCWQTKDENGNTLPDADKKALDVQEFVDILNGDSKEFEGPVYFGCDYGTNRTSSWYSFYNIVKDCDKSKPLPKETVQQLAELYNDLEELYKD